MVYLLANHKLTAMPEISCPRCAGETASQADRCKNCGYHISPEELSDIRRYNQLKMLGRVVFITLIGLAAVLLFLMYVPDPFEAERSVAERAMEEREVEEDEPDGAAVNGEEGPASLAEEHYERGMALMGSRDYEAAIGEFTKVLEIDSLHTGALMQRAGALGNMDDFEGAVRDLNRLTAVDPDHYEAHLTRGYIFFILEEYEEALEDFTTGVMLRPDDEYAWYQRGRARTSLDDDEGAIRDYNRALDLDPEFDEPWLYRGIGKFRLGDSEGACADWHRALELGHELAQRLIDDMCGE